MKLKNIDLDDILLRGCFSSLVIALAFIALSFLLYLLGYRQAETTTIVAALCFLVSAMVFLLFAVVVEGLGKLRGRGGER